MSFAAVGSFIQSGSNTVNLNNQGIGNLVLLEIIVESTAIVTSISGGGCTWKQISTVFTGTATVYTASIWTGTVITLGTQTATVNVSAGTPTVRIAGSEFSSTAKAWALDTQGNLDSGSGTNTWPSLTPTMAGELYFGFAIDLGSDVAGSTTGYTYNSTSAGNGCAWNPNCAHATQTPVWGDSGQRFGSMVLIKEIWQTGLLMAGIV